MIKKITVLTILGVLSLQVLGCVGWNLPQPFQRRPYTMLRGGEQIGRDQLANRFLVATGVLKLNGMHENEVLTILGQPQNIQAVEIGISEDWTYTYYKRYKTAPTTDPGNFFVRIYQQKVIGTDKIS